MKIKNEKKRKGWKRLLWVFSSLILISIVTAIILISPIVKFVVEKYDKQLLGREIKMDWAYVNPFTGYVHFDNLVIYEHDNDSVFFSAKGINADFAMLKLLSKTYEVSSLVIQQPVGKIVRDSIFMNFDDLVEKFARKDTNIHNLKGPIHLNILNIEIKNGTFYYNEPDIPIHYFIKNVDFKSTGKRWDVDSVFGDVTFKSGIGSGDVSNRFVINMKTLDYRMALIVKKLDLNIIEQYMRDLANYGSFRANVDANLIAKGNFDTAQNINLRGEMSCSDFHFGENEGNDYAAFEKVKLGIIEIDPEHEKYFFDSIILDKPYFKFELYDRLDNIQRMFGKGGAVVSAANSNPSKFNLIIEIANYVKDIFQNFLKSDYKIKTLRLNKGDLRFNDFSINEQFSATLSPLQIRADSIDNNKQWVKVFLESSIMPYGNVNVNVNMNPLDNKDFDLNYHISKIPAATFNPYLITYTSFPLDRGRIELEGEWHVRNDVIASRNHFLMIDSRVAKRVKTNKSKWIPLPLFMAFVQERGNVIDYEIPVSGYLKNPKFHLKDAVVDLIQNIFIKPSTIPYRIEVKNTETEIEKSLAMKWEMNQSSVNKFQDKFMQSLAEYLAQNAEATITIRPMTYDAKEKENILFFEAKKRYFLYLNKIKSQTITEKDSMDILKLSTKDPGFMKFLDSHAKDSMLFTIQDKCYSLVGTSKVNKKFNQLLKLREQAFLSYFKENNTTKQVKMLTSKNDIPYNGYSFFKIDYSGNKPEALIEAYEKLDAFNSESPRKQYLKFRKIKMPRAKID
ncbi:MAG: DUF748 domain-containing protein [bacterium]|nr:DUF748 domain-containing protein [bacterium]